MSGVVKSMDSALKSMNLEKVHMLASVATLASLLLLLLLQVAKIMDSFEKQFEHLDVQTQTMEEAMSGVTTLTVPEVHTHTHSHRRLENSLPPSLLRSKWRDSCRKLLMKPGE